MKLMRLALCAASASLTLAGAGVAYADDTPPAAPAPAAAPAAPAAPMPMALSTPAMSSTLSANSNPVQFDAGPFGKVYVGGAVSGLVNAQTNTIKPVGDHDWFGDLSNAQVFIQTTSGPVQFYIQAGAYSLPTLGLPYAHVNDSRNVVDNTFGYLPVAYIKLQPTADFSIMAGKLPTLVGAEYTFTFQNVNVNRGLLWYQEPAVSRGVQANYSHGPLTVSVSLTDGYYSNRYNWLTGLISFAVTKKDTIAAVGGGNLGKTPKSDFATAPPSNNGSIYNLLWTHTEDKWVFNPYFQYQHVGAMPAYGWTKSASAWGVAGLFKFVLTPEWNIGTRIEYEAQNGQKFDPAEPFLIPTGPGTNAFTATVTPTFQKGIFYVRADASYVHTSFPAFGTAFDHHDQFRFTGEAGILF